MLTGLQDEELNALRRQSTNVHIRILAHEDIDRLCTSIIRFPNRFRALIIASRGEIVDKCTNKCTNPSIWRFPSCIVIPGFEGGACAECVWNSDGHNCGHNADSQLSSSDDLSSLDDLSPLSDDESDP